MATCNFNAIEEAACANGFDCLDEGAAQAVELQMLYELSGSTMTLTQLEASACANGFDCMDAGDAENLEVQLLCEISGGA